MATLVAKREQRAKLVADARKINDAVEAGKAMTAEQRQEFDRLMSAAADLKADIERSEKLENEERELATSQGRRSTATAPEHRDGQPFTMEYRGLKLEVAHGQPGYSRTLPAYGAGFRSYCRTGSAAEMRTAAAFASDVDADGGYIHAPFQFVAEVIKKLDEAVFVRKYARVLPVTMSDSLGIPNMTTRPGDADWTTEVGSISADVSAQFGNRVLQPQLLTKLITVSQKLMISAAIPPEELVASELGSIYGRTEEKGYLTGSGSAQPLGAFTADNNGVPTSRDVSTGNTTTAITFDGLINTKYAVSAAYRAGARWLFHRDAVKNVATLKDGNGQYIWQMSKAESEPDMLLGHPVDESEYAPNTFTTGQYVGLFANWKWYWIADLMDLTVQRLNELFAANSKVGFLGRKYTDGAPVQSLAFARVKLA